MQSTELHDTMKKLIGEPVDSDNTFTHKARMLQGWYRAFVLNLSQGTGPNEKDDRLLPNMIPKSGELQPKANFLNDVIHQVVMERVKKRDIGGTIEEYRLFHNMLSSQPLAFNLFAPLSVDAELATELLQKIYPDEVKQVKNIIIEYAPVPADEYLGDKTAFDVFIEYEAVSNKLCFVGVETKYTEPFSQKGYSNDRYEALSRLPDSPFSKPVEELKMFNQLWRNTLLAYSLLKHESRKYHNGHALLLYMKSDDQITKMLSGFESCLKQPNQSFKNLDISDFVDLLRGCNLDRSLSKWIEDFSLRYLRFDLVEKLV